MVGLDLFWNFTLENIYRQELFAAKNKK